MEHLLIKDMTRFDWSGVAAALERRRLVALPADTVYGIACEPEPEALERLYAVKGRAPGKPVALVFDDFIRLVHTYTRLPAAVLNAAEELLPGPVTLILPAAAAAGKPGAAAVWEGGIGVRVLPEPQSGLFQRLPSPLALTSANLAGGADPCCVDDIPDSVKEACEFIVDAGPVENCAASTVVDLRPLAAGGPARILREGAMPRREVAALIGKIA